jgi:hypothetical protein
VSPLRALCPLLVLVLLFPTGLGRLDLCLCEAGDHGILCGQTDTPVQAQSGCCSRTGQTEQPAQEEEECPGCP